MSMCRVRRGEWDLYGSITYGHLVRHSSLVVRLCIHSETLSEAKGNYGVLPSQLGFIQNQYTALLLLFDGMIVCLCSTLDCN